jgi:hypothetical protein
MVRFTIKQAIDALINAFGMDEKVVNELAKNPVELGSKLLEVSNGTMALKGTREATNISFAPNEAQSTYKEAESLTGSIGEFIGKNGDQYECGVYCKKVVIKKDTKKK